MEHRDGFDRKISEDGVEASIWRLHTEITLGPDQQFAKYYSSYSNNDEHHLTKKMRCQQNKKWHV